MIALFFFALCCALFLPLCENMKPLMQNPHNATGMKQRLCKAFHLVQCIVMESHGASCKRHVCGNEHCIYTQLTSGM